MKEWGTRVPEEQWNRESLKIRDFGVRFRGIPSPPARTLAWPFRVKLKRHSGVIDTRLSIHHYAFLSCDFLGLFEVDIFPGWDVGCLHGDTTGKILGHEAVG